MDKFLKLSNEERNEVFTEAAIKRNIHPIIMEKDFWVCWMLKIIYSVPELSPIITFKGGTSISKAFGLIQRFSEDIDLTLDKSQLGTEFKNPLENNISNKEQARRIESVKHAAQQFVESTVLPLLKNRIVKLLGNDGNWTMKLDPQDKDQQTLLFNYPKASRHDEREVGYIKPTIRLEFGARGDIEPSTIRTISPYIAEIFPQLFETKAIKVPTLSIERTFWEKVTILHAIYHGSKFRDRLSRHYYDTYMISQDDNIIEKALKNNAALLKAVVLNKSIYFHDPKASYSTAKLGSLKLVPANEDIMKELENDYKAMDEMFMGEYPDFEAIMESLSKLEQRLNRI